MSVIVRVYQAIGHAEPGERYMARAIAMGRPRKDAPMGVEGFSVIFHSDDAEEAGAKAYGWIETERQRQLEVIGNRARAALKNSEHAASKRREPA